MIREKIKLPAGFNRDLRLLLYSMAVRRIAMGVLFLVRSIYFGLLGYNYTEVGLLLSLATLIAAIRQVIFGILSDRFGRKKFILLGAVFSTIRFIIFASWTGFWWLVLGQVVGALSEGAGPGQPVTTGYITDKTQTNERSNIFTALGVTNSFTTSIGFALAGLPALFMNNIGLEMVEAYAWLWWIGAFFSAISLLFVLPMDDSKPEAKTNEASTGEPEGEKFMGVSNWGTILRYSLIRSTNGLGYGLVGSLLPLYFSNQYGVGSEVLGPIYSLSRFATMFSYLFIPRVLLWLGMVRALMWTRVVSAGLILSFAFISWLPLALSVLFMYRIFFQFGMPITQNFASSLVSSGETATAVGVSNFFRMGLRTLAPTAAGYMFESLSAMLPFLGGAILVTINGGLYLSFYGGEKEDK